MDIQRLRYIRQELKELDAECRSYWNSFLKRYSISFDERTGRHELPFNSICYDDFNSTCNAIEGLLKRLWSYRMEVEAAEVEANQTGNHEMLMEAIGRKTFIRRIESCWKGLIEESQREFERVLNLYDDYPADVPRRAAHSILRHGCPVRTPEPVGCHGEWGYAPNYGLSSVLADDEATIIND